MNVPVQQRPDGGAKGKLGHREFKKSAAQLFEYMEEKRLEDAISELNGTLTPSLLIRTHHRRSHVPLTTPDNLNRYVSLPSSPMTNVAVSTKVLEASEDIPVKGSADLVRQQRSISPELLWPALNFTTHSGRGLSERPVSRDVRKGRSEATGSTIEAKTQIAARTLCTATSDAVHGDTVMAEGGEASGMGRGSVDDVTNNASVDTTMLSIDPGATTLQDMGSPSHRRNSSCSTVDFSLNEDYHSVPVVSGMNAYAWTRQPWKEALEKDAERAAQEWLIPMSRAGRKSKRQRL